MWSSGAHITFDLLDFWVTRPLFARPDLLHTLTHVDVGFVFEGVRSFGFRDFRVEGFRVQEFLVLRVCVLGCRVFRVQGL